MEEDDDMFSDDDTPSDIDFSILTMRWRQLTLFQDDLFLGMQGMNIGITDATITGWEYELLREYNEREKTPLDLATHVSAFSQMWLFAVYEVMRIWKDRIYQYNKWYGSGGVDTAISNLGPEDELNFTKEVKRRQLTRYRDDEEFRKKVDGEWAQFKPAFQMVELLRMNLAKHAAPGKDSMLTPAPGYGRINYICGAMDFEVVDKNGDFYFLNRRDIANALREAFLAIKT
ncbi:hypothetical protein [Cystobacter ferrugineus]|uniref:Uncharacterized protein n=1 Tax=Cystobacter ferrugineus TaxID=83449 RepID=A0A1L9BHR6_9BACT|nr:hypothetical protein [Cystobacter ferrugineus]OJH41769.1 hypothetical protein BON30_00570 [Cystobacter ferrugineus]